MGCLEILASMKVLDYDTRFLVAKECIYRVCEAANLRPTDRKRKVEKRVARSLGLQVETEHAGFNVTMNISSKTISLKTVEGNRSIATHEMPKISFASGGDSETYDFVAYVAKDDKEYRACYVLECARGMAQDVITTVGQAFNLRFKDYMKGPSVVKQFMFFFQDGDFLVRESSTTIGQYILTGLQAGTKKHLLLIDPEGMLLKNRAAEGLKEPALSCSEPLFEASRFAHLYQVVPGRYQVPGTKYHQVVRYEVVLSTRYLVPAWNRSCEYKPRPRGSWPSCCKDCGHAQSPNHQTLGQHGPIRERRRHFLHFIWPRAEPEVPKSPMVAHSPERIDKKHEAEVIAPVKTNKNDTVPSSTVSRDQLLSDVSAGKNEEMPPTPKQRSSFPNSDSSVLSPFGGISTNKSTTPVSPTSTDQNFPDSRVTLPAVSTNVLESLSKNRAKVKGRRRPPSRKHRQSQIEGDTKPILSPGYDEDPSKETPSEESSRTESVSTQPGSNILSPATDEEDLFVLPAFEPSAEHPSKGIFFGNSLLSPGASIDEGRSPSPLFPSTAKDSLFADSPRLDEFIVPETKQEKRPSPVPIQRTTTSTKRSQFAGAPHSRLDDLFSESPPKVDGPAKSSASLSDENGPSSPDFDIFSNSAVPKTARPDQLDLFSGESKASTFSSSPPLFSDFADLKSSSKTGKSTSKTKSSGLKWDLLGSDDLGEDLFRPQIKQSSSSNKSTSDTGKVKPNSPVPSKKKQDDLFAPPAASKKKASTDAGGLFDDVNEFLSSDIFSDSSSFMRLSLPKNQKENSLFGSDDDDDDDSLFKTSKKPSASMPPSLEKPSKSQEYFTICLSTYGTA
ncbi:unnamed protein product [Nesidiocoris tenuis]|uniref:PID domain-containing protein n=1 Tax=Nesidiocoris tenuis TaxID=355587 RepID=A0A6H5HMI3_9HEMI|nr:unnamed protein product [Nesidiocoris tenuis]